MKSKRSRLALVGVLALALSVTVGLASGSVADAKKKKGGKGGVITVSHGPQGLTQATGTPPSITNGVTPVIFTVGGKRAKGKVVSADSVTITFTLTGGAGFATDYSARLINPLGRTIGLSAPGLATSTTIGPLTQSPNSPGTFCNPAVPGSCQPGSTAFAPTFAGTIGNTGLAFLTGTRVSGNWTLELRRFTPTAPAASLASAVLTIGTSG